MNKKKKTRRKKPQHNIKIAKVRSGVVSKRRMEEAAEIKSPALSLEQLCQLADAILRPSGGDKQVIIQAGRYPQR